MPKCHFGVCGKTATKRIKWEGKTISVCDQDSDPKKNTRKSTSKKK